MSYDNGTVKQCHNLDCRAVVEPAGDEVTAPIAMVVVLIDLVFVVAMSHSAPLATAEDGSVVRDLLVGRFIDRSQRFRRAGAIVGITLMAAYLIVADAADGGGVNIDFLVLATIGLAGSIAGSILAEAFRVRQPGPRTASLDVRDPAVYRDRAADQRERVLLVMAAVGLAGSTVTGQHLGRVAILGVVVALLALVRHWATRRIALRPRSVVSADVAAADDEVRRLATSAGISRPIVTLAALAVSSQWFAVISQDADLSGSVQIASAVAWLGSISLFLIACQWWWNNRSFGLTPMHLQAAGGSRSYLRWWALAIIGGCIAMMALVVQARGSG